MIETRALRFSYPGNPLPVLKSIDWSIQAGEFNAILGPNGCGKTTLLKLLAAEVTPQSGEIFLRGKPLSTYSSEALAQERAVLTQSPRLDFNFSVHEVVLMGRSPYLGTCTRSENLAATEAALDALHLQTFAHRIYPQLSRGEKQRVQLARVLAQLQGFDPSKKGVLLLDEPINHLDIAHQHLTLSLAQDRAAQGHTVVAVLHDLNLALQYAQTVTILHEGTLFRQGEPAAVLDEACLATVFKIRSERILDAKGRPYLHTHGPL